MGKLDRNYSNPDGGRWVFKAVVNHSNGSKAFTGYGDADPSNVSQRVWGAEMRVAETRAVNRAIRKAYGIGLCSVEELGSPGGSDTRSQVPRNHATSQVVPSNGQPLLRDRLLFLIRQHQLDASLVKAYARAFCETEDLRDARREQIESFVEHLAEWAVRDRDSLLCKLNSFTLPQEVKA